MLYMSSVWLSRVSLTGITSTLSPQEIEIVILLTGIDDLTSRARPLFVFSRGVVYVLYTFTSNFLPMLISVSRSVITSYFSVLQYASSVAFLVLTPQIFQLSVSSMLVFFPCVSLVRWCLCVWSSVCVLSVCVCV